MIRLNVLLSLVLNYYLYDKNVTILYFFNCRTKTGKILNCHGPICRLLIYCLNIVDNLHISNYLSDRGMTAALIQLNDYTDVQQYSSMIDQKFTPNSGLLLDYNCSFAFDLLELSSQKEYFCAKNKWMILEEIDELNASPLLKQLSTSHLYVNAEISYFNAALMDTTTK